MKSNTLYQQKGSYCIGYGISQSVAASCHEVKLLDSCKLRCNRLVIPLSFQTKNRSPCLLNGVTDLLHLGLQLYNSSASWHKAATGGLIPYSIQ